MTSANDEARGGRDGKEIPRCTNFVRRLIDGNPSAAEVDEIWDLLRAWLRGTLRRRSIWHLPPAYLGITGFERWADGAQGGGLPSGETRDALDELAQEAFKVVFVQRLPYLIRYVESGREVEGVVRRALGQVVHTLQAKEDQTGDRHYQWLRSAVEEGVRRGQIRVVGKGSPLGNQSVLRLGLDPHGGANEEPSVGELEEGPAARRASGTLRVSSKEIVQEVIRHWNDELFVDLLTGSNKEVHDAVQRLTDELLKIPSTGLVEVGFGELLEAWTSDTRSRQALLYGDVRSQIRASDQGEESGISLGAAEQDWIRREEEVEYRGRFQILSTCVEQRILEGGGHKKTRQILKRLWRLLGKWAHLLLDGPESEDAEPWLDAEKFPANRELARALGIHHERIPGLMSRLKKEVAECLGSTGLGPENLQPTPWSAGDPGTSDIRTSRASGSVHEHDGESFLTEPADFRHELLAQSLRIASERKGSSPPSAGLGTAYPLDGGEIGEVEWLALLEIAEESLLVPLDSEPWTGIRDLEVSCESGELKAVIRPSLGFWIPSHRLPERGSTEVGAEDLKRAQDAHELLYSDSSTGPRASLAEDDDPAWEDEIHPEYRKWMHSLDRERRILCRALDGNLDEGPREAKGIKNQAQMIARDSGSESGEVEGAGGKGNIRPFRQQDTTDAGKPRSEYGPPDWRRIAAMLVMAAGFSVISGSVYLKMQADQERWEKSEAERLELLAKERELTQELEQKESSEARLKEELEADRLAAQQARLRDREAFEAELESVKGDFQEQIAELDEPEILPGSIFVPAGTQRGLQTLVLDASHRSVLVEVIARNGDEVQVVEWPGNKVVHEIEVNDLEVGRNLILRIPRARVTPGEIRVFVDRDGRRVTQFRFILEEKQDEEDFWP